MDEQLKMPLPAMPVRSRRGTRTSSIAQAAEAAESKTPAPVQAAEPLSNPDVKAPEEDDARGTVPGIDSLAALHEVSADRQPVLQPAASSSTEQPSHAVGGGHLWSPGDIQMGASDTNTRNMELPSETEKVAQEDKARDEEEPEVVPAVGKLWQAPQASEIVDTTTATVSATLETLDALARSRPAEEESDRDASDDESDKSEKSYVEGDDDNAIVQHAEPLSSDAHRPHSVARSFEEEAKEVGTQDALPSAAAIPTSDSNSEPGTTLDGGACSVHEEQNDTGDAVSEPKVTKATEEEIKERDVEPKEVTAPCPASNENNQEVDKHDKGEVVPCEIEIGTFILEPGVTLSPVLEHPESPYEEEVDYMPSHGQLESSDGRHEGHPASHKVDDSAGATDEHPILPGDTHHWQPLDDYFEGIPANESEPRQYHGTIHQDGGGYAHSVGADSLAEMDEPDDVFSTPAPLEIRKESKDLAPSRAGSPVLDVEHKSDPLPNKSSSEEVHDDFRIDHNGIPKSHPLSHEREPDEPETPAGQPFRDDGDQSHDGQMGPQNESDLPLSEPVRDATAPSVHVAPVEGGTDTDSQAFLTPQPSAASPSLAVHEIRSLADELDHADGESDSDREDNNEYFGSLAGHDHPEREPTTTVDAHDRFEREQTTTVSGHDRLFDYDENSVASSLARSVSPFVENPGDDVTIHAQAAPAERLVSDQKVQGEAHDAEVHSRATAQASNAEPDHAGYKNDWAEESEGLSDESNDDAATFATPSLEAARTSAPEFGQLEGSRGSPTFHRGLAASRHNPERPQTPDNMPHDASRGLEKEDGLAHPAVTNPPWHVRPSSDPQSPHSESTISSGPSSPEQLHSSDSHDPAIRHSWQMSSNYAGRLRGDSVLTDNTQYSRHDSPGKGSPPPLPRWQRNDSIARHSLSAYEEELECHEAIVESNADTTANTQRNSTGSTASSIFQRMRNVFEQPSILGGSKTANLAKKTEYVGAGYGDEAEDSDEHSSLLRDEVDGGGKGVAAN